METVLSTTLKLLVVIINIAAVEIVGVSWRGHFGTAVNYFWTLGYMLLAGIAYGLRHWWILQLVIASSTSVLLLSAL